MLIYVFPPHYQLVYISFDISSFSVISYIRMRENLHTDINLFSPVYKFRCIGTYVFSWLFILYLLDLLSAFPYSYRALTCLVVLPIPSSLISSFCLLGYMFAADIFQISPRSGLPCYCPCNSRY